MVGNVFVFLEIFHRSSSRLCMEFSRSLGMETRTSTGGSALLHTARRSGGQSQGKCLSPKCMITIVYHNAETICHPNQPVCCF